MLNSSDSFISRYGLYLAWLMACLGTLFSLYYSEIRHLEPCHLCWYQRICLFPLTIILGLAAYRGALEVARFVLPLAIIGFLLATYQVALQEIPGWNPIDICGGGPSCDHSITVVGFLTIPMLSAAGFAVIATFLTLVWRYSQTSTRLSAP